MKTQRLFIALLPAVALLAGCTTSKSANPLSPTVAGPIPGVQISAPKLLEPGAGWQMDSTKQPLTLMVENAGTTGVRPLTYAFEVASDAAFTNTVFSRSAVAQGDGGRTSLRLPDALGSGRTYYWRARAEDGANTGPFAAPANFVVFTPVVIGQAQALAPINGVVTSSTLPQFVIGNAPRTGPAGAITYTIEIATDAGFSSKEAIWNVGEQAGQTTLTAPGSLDHSRTYFWHVRAFDPNTIGPWSDTQAFQTPAAAAAPPPPSGGGGGGGNWQSCGSTPGDALVACVVAAVHPGTTVEGAFEVTKRVAWLLRGGGAGLLIKNGGENIVSWQGYSFAAGRICYPDGHIYKVLSDVPGTNGPAWSDNGFVDPSLYVRAIDPGN